MATFLKVKFLAKDLKKIHVIHRGYIVASSHACNQINFSKVYHIFEDSRLPRDGPENAFTTIRQLNLIRYCISAMFEFNDMTAIYLGKARALFPNFAEKHRGAYAPIARAISNARWMRKIRNKVTFHFDSNETAKMLDNISDNQKLYFIFGEKGGDIVYSFAEEIISSNIAFDVGGGDLQGGSDTMWTVLNDLSIKISEFHSRLCIDIFKQYGLFSNLDSMKSSDDSHSLPGERPIPVFVRRDR